MAIKSAAVIPLELTQYLDGLGRNPRLAEVIVVDGSIPHVFADFHARCAGHVRHVPVHPRFAQCANGKVAGVLTGLRLARTPLAILADEDVRYDEGALDGMERALDAADVVRPQNYFHPLPWHASLDTARMLINRVTGGDWPGTLGVRCCVLERTGGYDGNVLFENLELVRTVRAAGGREARPLNLFVRRLPPRSHHFWSQRVRQAYDEFARPVRLCLWLGLLPASIWFGLRRPRAWALLAPLIPMLIAEAGRRVGEGDRVFPGRAVLMAPVWVLERALCSWVAVAARVGLGGVPYRGRVMRQAANPLAVLIRRHGHMSRHGRVGV